MKLVLFDDYRPGLLKGDRVVDISDVVYFLPHYPPQALMEAIITSFGHLRRDMERVLEREEGVPVGEVRLRPPLPRSSKLLCCRGNYKEGTDRPVQPLDMFFKSPDSVIGPGDTVVLPEAKATIFHHEAELAFVIGARAKNIRADKTMEYVFGYTCFIDVSARGLTRQGAASMSAKSFDTFGPLGPALVTADEIPDPHKLAVKLWVNGEIRHDYSTSDMEHGVQAQIEYASSIMTLHPGDTIACGTNHQGLGPVQDGDLVEIEIEGIGRFAVSVRDPYRRSWPRGVDREAAQSVRARSDQMAGA